MTTYYITRDIEAASGWQTFSVEADSKEEAMEKFESGDDSFVDEDVEITDLSEIDFDQIHTGEEGS